MNSPSPDQLQHIIQRVELLEQATFGAVSIQQPQGLPTSEKKVAGPKGGVITLLDKGYFTKKRNLRDVRAALIDEGYIYSRQSVHNALKRLATNTGPLVSIAEGKQKIYAERR